MAVKVGRRDRYPGDIWTWGITRSGYQTRRTGYESFKPSISCYVLGSCRCGNDDYSYAVEHITSRRCDSLRDSHLTTWIPITEGFRGIIRNSRTPFIYCRVFLTVDWIHLRARNSDITCGYLIYAARLLLVVVVHVLILVVTYQSPLPR